VLELERGVGVYEVSDYSGGMGSKTALEVFLLEARLYVHIWGGCWYIRPGMLVSSEHLLSDSKRAAGVYIEFLALAMAYGFTHWRNSFLLIALGLLLLTVHQLSKQQDLAAGILVRRPESGRKSENCSEENKNKSWQRALQSERMGQSWQGSRISSSDVYVCINPGNTNKVHVHVYTVDPFPLLPSALAILTPLKFSFPPLCTYPRHLAPFIVVRIHISQSSAFLSSSLGRCLTSCLC